MWGGHGLMIIVCVCVCGTGVRVKGYTFSAKIMKIVLK